METDIRGALASALKSALKQRDREALSVYRTALAAIANAEAVSAGEEHRAGAIEASVTGVGGAEVARRELTEDDVVTIVRNEIAERRSAASAVRSANPVAAERLERDASLLEAVAGSGADAG
ncbi:hypothetical protein [Cryptosporangium arvum]|uniref:hypothetical protein n=1 Tax=Cryptosporangium arvum TaxID=80871 RepID=UPI0004B0C6CA|nr:hypothetical protein [Cryptosporangium arvum]